MSSITIQLADEDLNFLQAFSKLRGTSAAELLAEQARNLRRRLELPLPEAVLAASGIIQSDADLKASRDRQRDEKNR